MFSNEENHIDHNNHLLEEVNRLNEPVNSLSLKLDLRIMLIKWLWLLVATRDQSSYPANHANSVRFIRQPPWRRFGGELPVRREQIWEVGQGVFWSTRWRYISVGNIYLRVALFAPYIFYLLSHVAYDELLCYRYLALQYSTKHADMANPRRRGCGDADSSKFGKQGGITNGAKWYSLQGGNNLTLSYSFLVPKPFSISIDWSSTHMRRNKEFSMQSIQSY